MNLLGVDYGEKRIGLAIGSDETKTATPLGVLKNKGHNFVFEEIEKVCTGEKINKIIVGMPLTLASEKGPQAKEVLRFIEFLKHNLGVPVETEDERFTSAMVDKLMIETKMRERDAVAAMLILQGYLDRQK